jgi:hypothetical protein
MTITEMHQSFRFGLDKLDNLNYPNFLPEEIDLLLNQAQERIVKQRYGTTNTKRTSFEETQKRTEDLKELVRHVNLNFQNSNPFNVTSNSRFVTLPNDHWFIIQERVVQQCDKCNSTPLYTETYTQSLGQPPLIESVNGMYAEVRPIQHNEIDKVLKDAFKAPDYDKVLRLMVDGMVEIIPSSVCTPVKYRLRYIKKPIDVNITSTPIINCELSEHLHQEIVDEAIKIALEGIEAKRNQTFTPIIDNQKE